MFLIEFTLKAKLGSVTASTTVGFFCIFFLIYTFYFWNIFLLLLNLLLHPHSCYFFYFFFFRVFVCVLSYCFVRQNRFMSLWLIFQNSQKKRIPHPPQKKCQEDLFSLYIGLNEFRRALLLFCFYFLHITPHQSEPNNAIFMTEVLITAHEEWTPADVKEFSYKRIKKIRTIERQWWQMRSTPQRKASFVPVCFSAKVNVLWMQIFVFYSLNGNACTTYILYKCICVCVFVCSCEFQT